MNENHSELDHLILFQEHLLLKPETRKSAEELDLLLADEFIEICSSGEIVNKQQTISALLGEPLTFRELRNFTISHLAPTVVLITYEASTTSSDAITVSSSLRSSIWKQKDHLWKIVFHQGTKMKITQ